MWKKMTGLAVTAALTGVATLPVAAERVEQGNLVLEGIPEIPPEVAERYQQYQNTRSARLRGWHPSGEGILITTRFGETSQVHWVREPGGTRRQLTFYDEPVGQVEPVPGADVNAFIMGKDVGGSEFYQLFLFSMDAGRHRMITDGTSRNGAAEVSNRGDRIAYYSTQRNGTDWDLFVAPVTGKAMPRPVLTEGGFWVPLEWSPDDERLLVLRYVSVNESYPHVLDLASGELTELRPSDEKISYGAAVWSHDGTGVYLTSDEGSEFQHLRRLDLASGELETLTGDIPWDVGEVALSPDGRHLAFTVSEDGIGRLHVWDAATLRPAMRTDLPVGQLYGLAFSPDSSQLGVNVNSARSPGDVYAVHLADGTTRRWTFSEVGGLDSAGLVSPRLVRYPTFDEVDGAPRQIPAFYYPPPGDGPFPVLLYIHGGPEGQHRPFFSSKIQYLVNELGIAVVAPNVRGSAGYGKSYLLLDNGMLREDSVKDIGALLDWVAEQSELDEDRVAVYGGSYGGYMVLASMVRYGDRLRGGVDVVGISNFVTFLENTQDYRRDLRRVEYGDERDPEMRAHLERISPNNRAAEIRKPLLIGQGLNDPRVPASESEQILAAVRANGGEAWYFLAKDEGHGFRKKSNRDHFDNAMSLFLEKILLEGE